MFDQAPKVSTAKVGDARDDAIKYCSPAKNL